MIMISVKKSLLERFLNFIKSNTILGCLNMEEKHVSFLGPGQGISHGPGGPPPQAFNGRRATWAMRPPETRRQMAIWV